MENTCKIMPKIALDNSDVFIENQHNNDLINQCLDLFCHINELGKQDIVVMGSAAASYMQYLAITKNSDVDVHVLNKRNMFLHKSRNIDILVGSLLPVDYIDRLQEKDGYLFISDVDFLIHTTCAVLYRILYNRKRKESHLIYSKLMIKELNLSKDEFKKLIKKSIGLTTIADEKKQNLLNNLYLLDELYADVFEEENTEQSEQN